MPFGQLFLYRGKRGGRQVRIMTFNVRSDSLFDGKNRWHKRRELVFEVLEKYDCDIIGLQEVTPKMHQDLQKRLVDYEMIGQARTKKWFVEHNNILVSKRHHILEEETFWLSNHPKKEGSSIWYSVFPRICTTAKIKLQSGELIRVYNTHLDCYLSPARNYGLKKIMTYIKKQQAVEKLPIILMGDFNASPHHRLIKDFIKGETNTEKLIAVQEYDQTIYQKATMGKFKDKEHGMHLDYIFISPEYKAVNTQIIKDNKQGRFPSDHYPLMADIRLT